MCTKVLSEKPKASFCLGSFVVKKEDNIETAFCLILVLQCLVRNGLF
jgi:hypothetical protein